MSVCEECGLNIEIMGTHLPGCSHYVQEEHEKAVSESEKKIIDGAAAWNAVMETASDRGIAMARSMMKAYLIDNGLTPPDEFDEALVDIMTISSWAGVLAAIQVFSEQEFIDRKAVINFVESVPNFGE